MPPRVITLTAHRLRELLDYNPETGEFRWRVHSGRGRKPGQPAGVVEPNGYRTICVDGRRYQAQRLAWLHVTGEHAKNFVRFKDEDRGNLKFDNLVYGRYVTGDGYDTREGRASYMRELRRQNPGIQKGEHFGRQYGIGIEQFRAMAEAQNNLCAICGKPETRRDKHGQISWLSIDHHHGTKKIRDLLCRNCNLVVGYANEDPAILDKAAAYLRRHAGPRNPLIKGFVDYGVVGKVTTTEEIAHIVRLEDVTSD